MRRVIRIAVALLVAGLLPTTVAEAQTAERYLLAERPTAMLKTFNVSDNTEVSSALTGVSPEAIVVSPNGRLAFVANLNSAYISVVDLTINTEIERIHGVRGRSLALTDDGMRLVIPIVASGRNSDQVAIVDTSTLTIIDTNPAVDGIQNVSLDGLVGDDPNNGDDIGMGAVVVVGSRAYVNTGVGFANRLIGVVDLYTFSVNVVAGSAIGNTPPGSSIAATPDGSTVVALRLGPPTLLIIGAVTNTVVQNVNPGTRPLALAMTRELADPDGVFGYLARGGAVGAPGILDVINPTTGQILSSATLPFSITAPASQNIEMALSADSNLAYVVTSDLAQPKNLVVIDTGLLLSNPAAAVVHQRRVGFDLRAVALAITQATPPATAPQVSSVDPSLVVNDEVRTVRITGAGFNNDARVRFGNLDPVTATVLSSSELEAAIPAHAPAQGADIVVTNANPFAPVADQHQSGILRGELIIASPPAFQPANQVLVTNFGEGTLAVLNVSTDATVTPKIAVGNEPLGLAITPDGERAYVEVPFNPPGVADYKIVQGQVEGSITSFSAASRLGQLDGIAIATHPTLGRPVAYVVDGVQVGPGFAERLNIIDADPAPPALSAVIGTIQASTNDGLPTRGGLGVTPDGRYVYSNSFTLGPITIGGGRIVIFDVVTGMSTSYLTSTLGVSPFQPRVHVAPDGESLLLGTDQGEIKVFDIANQFNPTLVATLAQAGPTYEVVGNRLFAFDVVDQVVYVFNFDRSTNNFSQLGSLPLGGTQGLFAAGMAVTPDGNLIYAVQREDDAVAVVDTARLIAGDPGALLTKVRTGLAASGAAVRPGTPTAAGTNVSTKPIQEVTITFDSVTSGGGTTATTTYTNPNPTPAGFQLGDPPIFYEIETSATFTGPVEVCFTYKEGQFTGPESELRVLHEENGTFVDRTVSLDTAANKICGQVSSFSAFVVGLGSVDFLFDSLLEAINDSVQHPGVRRALRAPVLAARGARDRRDGGSAINQISAFKELVGAQTAKNLIETDAGRLISLADSLISRF